MSSRSPLLRKRTIQPDSTRSSRPSIAPTSNGSVRNGPRSGSQRNALIDYWTPSQDTEDGTEGCGGDTSRAVSDLARADDEAPAV